MYDNNIELMGNTPVTDYNGKMKNGKRHGKGTQYSDYNCKVIKYEGYFKNNKYHKEGKLYKQGNLRYEGSFVNGLANGKGILYDTDESGTRSKLVKLYEGTLEKNHYHGYGTLYKLDGDILYRGRFKRKGNSTVFDGRGMFYLKNFIINTIVDNGVMKYTHIYCRNGENYAGDMNYALKITTGENITSLIHSLPSLEHLKSMTKSFYSETNRFNEVNANVCSDNTLDVLFGNNELTEKNEDENNII